MTLAVACNGVDFVPLATAVPVATDAPPVAADDTFVVPLGAQTALRVLDNDTAALLDLVVTSATTPPHGAVALCPDGTCIHYTPQIRFSGWDTLSYTAADRRGRVAAAVARVRLSTTPPRWVALPTHADLTEGAVTLPLAAAGAAYDDATWRLTAAVTLELEPHAGGADGWPAGVLALGGDAGASVAGADGVTLVATGAHAVTATFGGVLADLVAMAARLAVTPPPRYSGAGVLTLDLCSEWGECSVRSLSYMP